MWKFSSDGFFFSSYVISMKILLVSFRSELKFLVISWSYLAIASHKPLTLLNPSPPSTYPCRGVLWALHSPHISLLRNSPETPLLFSSLMVTLPTLWKARPHLSEFFLEAIICYTVPPIPWTFPLFPIKGKKSSYSKFINRKVSCRFYSRIASLDTFYTHLAKRA